MRQKREALSPKGESLRKSLALLAAGVAAASTLTLFKAPALGSPLLRPPGAQKEGLFLAMCSRCGQCLQACPYDAVKLGAGEHGIAMGTPYIEARKNPCRLCQDWPCIKACPTGALQEVVSQEKANMGTAVIEQETCIAWQGLRCEICYRQCPLLDKAITLDLFHNQKTQKHAIFGPVVHKDYCAGCGICENVCVVEPSAITIKPRR